MTLGLKLLVPFSLAIFILSYFTVWQKDVSVPVISAVFTVLFSLPALWGLYVWVGIKKAVLLFLALSVFSYTIESIGLLTGFPYGEFSYSSKVGILLFNFIPLALPFAWIPLLLGAFALSFQYKKNVSKFFVVTVIMTVLIDVVLDPGAVSLNFWQFSGSSIWYGIPISNYLGWILSAVIGFLIAIKFLKGVNSHPPQYISYSYFYSLVFWTGVCVFSSMWLAVVVGLILQIYILRLYISKPDV